MSSKQYEQDFRAYFIKRLDDESFASEYLKSGLSSDLNPDNLITPDFFTRNFLVERKGYEAISQRIHALFRSNDHNLLGIESERGSGKSTFVNTMHLAKDKKFYFEYPYPYIDLTKRNSYNKYCENIISDLFYDRLAILNADKEWHAAFYEKASKVSIQGNDIRRALFIQTALNEAMNACRDKESYDSFLYNHDSRVEKYRDCDIKVFLLLYLLTLATKPIKNGDKETRWIIVFDGIEAYVTRDAEDVIVAITDIYNFIEQAFESIGLRDFFYIKFTFVIPIRTATSLNIQNSVVTQGRNIWGTGNTKENIVKLPKSDFSLEALLKKMEYFLKIGIELQEIEKKKLFIKCASIVSLLIPYPNIIQYLKKDINISQATDKLRFFAEQRLLPLLNNDHRSLVDKLCDLSAFSEDGLYYKPLLSIENSINQGICQTKYALNGKNMIVFRNMFDGFHRENLLDRIGYSDLNDRHQPGVTRTMLNFLYYKEWEYRLNNSHQTHYGGEYKGVAFDKLLDMLKPFAEKDIQQLSLVLYRISALNAASILPSYWTNLIVIRGLEDRLDEAGFEEVIRAYYFGKDEKGTQRVQRMIRNWRVKLSDAGSCFSHWASKQFEFILSRCNNELGTTALFAYDVYINIQGLIDACYKVLSIIRTEAIEKLIDGCLFDCEVCSNMKAFSHCTFENNLLECSLFQRYQECLFIIMESINYIDRFRLYVLEISLHTAKPVEEYNRVNNQLLDIIATFDALFGELKNKVEQNFPKSEAFFEKMRSVSEQCSKLLKAIESTKDPSCIEIECSKRLRPPRTTIWYLNTEKEMKAALEKAKKYPIDVRLYNILDAKQPI